MDWFSVRCVLQFVEDIYEERITLWTADTFDRAIEQAELDAIEYAESLGGRYVGLAQAYLLDGPPESGSEVFSLIRHSSLDAEAYVSAFFVTGTEHQHEDDE